MARRRGSHEVLSEAAEGPAERRPLGTALRPTVDATVDARPRLRKPP